MHAIFWQTNKNNFFISKILCKFGFSSIIPKIKVKEFALFANYFKSEMHMHAWWECFLGTNE